MGKSADLVRVLRALSGKTTVNLAEYTAHPVGGALQSSVWLLSPPPGLNSGEFALRLTPKPYGLIERIGRIVDGITTVTCARTLAAAPTDDGRTAHLATWLPETVMHSEIGMRELGFTLSRLHRELAAQPDRLRDRPLTFDLVDTADSWSRARQCWVRGTRGWPRINGPAAARQPIHGDTHEGNYLRTSAGEIGFIDFDKMMGASPTFDLARIIGGVLFNSTTAPAAFDTAGACDLLESYYAPGIVGEAVISSLEGFAVMLTEVTGILSRIHDDPERRERADRLGRWWLERIGHRDPMGLRSELTRRTQARTATRCP